PFGVVSYSVLLRWPPSNQLDLPSFVAVLLCSPPFIWVEMTCGGPNLFGLVGAVLSMFSASRSPPYIGCCDLGLFGLKKLFVLDVCLQGAVGT
ncbi:hypothetical protein A2U01_0051353, partial [Trifolium medium]|nr:hypothetical protein [Trifolium medium]